MKNKKKCSDSTREILKQHKQKIMCETLECLKELREALQVKEIA